MEQAEKVKSNIDKAEKDLEKDEKNAEEPFLVAQRILSHASNCISTAIAKNNMVVIRIANELLYSAQQGCEKASLHREELRKVHASIGSKRRKAMAQQVK